MNYSIRLTLVAAAAALQVSPLNADSTTLLWYDQPAPTFKESLPLGNGRVGAMVFGGVNEERIVLNESSVWSGSPQDADRPGAHKALPDIRRLLLEGKNAEAEQLVNANFTCRGQGSGHGSGANVPFGCYQVLGNLRLRFHGAEPSVQPRCSSGHRAYFAEQEIQFSTDGNPQTKWCVIHEGKPVQWTLDAGKSIEPRNYSFTSAEDVPARDPRTWLLEASPDGHTWQVLDQRSDQSTFSSRHERRSYVIKDPVPSRFFRFTFQPNAGVDHFQVAEISIDGLKTGGHPLPDSVMEYRRELDLQTATARVFFVREGIKYTRTHFVTAPDQVIVSRLTASESGRLSFDLSLDRPERFTTTADGPNELVMTGTLNDGSGGTGVSYVCRVRVLLQGGKATAEGNKLIVTDAREVLLLVSAATDFAGFARKPGSSGDQSGTKGPLLSTKIDLDRAAARSFEALHRDHVADFRQWFDRVELRLPEAANSALATERRLQGFARGAADPALGALYFNYGRYLLISSSRPGGLPANLQGIWAEEIQTPWNGDWHLDINVQMNYWPA